MRFCFANSRPVYCYAMPVFSPESLPWINHVYLEVKDFKFMGLIENILNSDWLFAELNINFDG